MLKYIQFFPSTILNRLRGTGSMFYLNINGNILYALYLFTLVGFLSFVFDYKWEWSFLVVVLYVVGESGAWGKWVSYLCEPINHPLEYDNDDGTKFPYIHYIANTIVNQRKHYRLYCIVALSLRGLYWWLPLYTLLGWLFGNIYLGISLGITIGILFSVSSILSNKYLFKFIFDYREKIRMKNTIVYECKNNWERQEVIYGTFQEVTLWLLIIISIIIKYVS